MRTPANSPLLIFFLTALLAIALPSARAGELKAGAAQVEITPATGAPMAGYFSFRPVEGVIDPLFAKTIVVEQDGARAAFIVLDLVTTSETVVAAARRLIDERCGVPAERVMISATHTHTGPALPRGTAMDDLTKAGSPPGLQYANSLPELITRSVADALAQLTPARASAAVGQAVGVSFNRRVIGKDGRCIWQPSKIDPALERPAGPVDPDLGLLVFEAVAPRPAPIAAYVNFAMHPTRRAHRHPGIVWHPGHGRSSGIPSAVRARVGSQVAAARLRGYGLSRVLVDTGRRRFRGGGGVLVRDLL